MTRKRLLLALVALLVSAGAFGGNAAAATAPVLDREQVGPYFNAPAIDCSVDGGRTSLTVDFKLGGFATLPYSSFSAAAAGSASFALVSGNGYLDGLQASFTLPSAIGTATGSISTAPTTKGNATCDVETDTAVLEIRGAAYTAHLPDGGIDFGLVDILLSADGGSPSFSVAFDSRRSPELDADRDGVWDGDDNCPATANADQRDVDADWIGDVCDPYDGRPALTLLGELWADTRAVRNGSKLVAKVDHAIQALQAGQVGVVCTDLAGYVTQVQSARGKTIPAATADVLLAKARHIRTVLAC